LEISQPALQRAGKPDERKTKKSKNNPTITKAYPHQTIASGKNGEKRKV